MGNNAGWTNPGGTLSMADAALSLEYVSGPPPVLPTAPIITQSGTITSTAIPFTLSSGANITTLTPQRSPAGLGDWTSLAPIAADAAAYTFTGLEPQTAYDFRFLAENQDGIAYSNQVTRTTTEAIFAPFFSDGFERSSILPFSQNGANWSGVNSVSAQSDTPLLGSRSARFRYDAVPDGEDCTAELAMDGRSGGSIGRNLTKFSLRYLMLLPENWVHRSQTHLADPDRRSSNNKGIVQLWSGSYGAAASNQFIGFEYWPQSNGGSEMTLRAGRDGVDLAHTSAGQDSMFSPSDPGKRIQYRVFVQLASGPGQFDGIIRVWKFVEGSSPIMTFEKTNWGYSTRGNYIDQLYVLGWANSGFSQQTDIYVDDFNIMDGDLIDWGSFR